MYASPGALAFDRALARHRPPPRASSNGDDVNGDGAGSLVVRGPFWFSPALTPAIASWRAAYEAVSPDFRRWMQVYGGGDSTADTAEDAAAEAAAEAAGGGAVAAAADAMTISGAAAERGAPAEDDGARGRGSHGRPIVVV